MTRNHREDFEAAIEAIDTHIDQIYYDFSQLAPEHKVEHTAFTWFMRGNGASVLLDLTTRKAQLVTALDALGGMEGKTVAFEQKGRTLTQEEARLSGHIPMKDMIQRAINKAEGNV